MRRLNFRGPIQIWANDDPFSRAALVLSGSQAKSYFELIGGFAMSECAGHYAITRRATLAHWAIGLLPPLWREHAANRCLRREAPGPACEHAVQYLLSAARRTARDDKSSDACIVRGADLFYSRQYRQYLNAVMGAFAMTATQALVASGGALRGRLWRRRRKCFAAMLEEVEGAPPILVIDRETVAVPLLLPEPCGNDERVAVESWLAGTGRMPEMLRTIASGQEVRCADPWVVARERSADGAILEVVDAVLHSRKLALLALHPHDPDAMGLHITLFGVEPVSPQRLEADYGLEASALEIYRSAARIRGRMLAFCVGGTEEVFTQCSQNLFVKRAEPRAASPARPAWPKAWDPRERLERLLAHQFEMIQATVSAEGLPGASPRNGDIGKAGFVARAGAKLFVLIPYFPGNSVHGHAGKLWSNPYGSLVISDDHTALTRVTISGPARVLSYASVQRKFSAVAAESMTRQRAGSLRRALPDYWFLQEVAEIVQESEPLAANRLDPQRPTCSINAGGQAKHDKKPAYFAADTLPEYDRHLQHEREAAGRPTCFSGSSHRRWLATVGTALTARHAHLAGGQDEPLIREAEREALMDRA
jgi:hypothetical protein